MTETQKYLQLIGEWRKCLAFSLGFGPQHCLRCKTVALIRIERHVGITFFARPNRNFESILGCSANMLRPIFRIGATIQKNPPAATPPEIISKKLVLSHKRPPCREIMLA